LILHVIRRDRSPGALSQPVTRAGTSGERREAASREDRPRQAGA